MKSKKKIIGSIAILCILSIFAIVGYFTSRPSKVPKEEDIFVENTKDKVKSSKQISVYINGEVHKPGVYKLEENDRVEDLINKAGGYTSNADTFKVNLAKKLKDEDYIYVTEKKNSKNSVEDKESNSSSNTDEDKININNASKEELKTIPGIGDVTAQKILDYREKNGGFSKIEDLKKIDRIGDKTLEKIKDKVDI
ncbi:DNA-binding protein [Clostridium niameyense]|uniref:DNA-binding protein n=1 Tax=Clostridium niameyense TaxID=1622073 RepID=A0A6M0R6A3_9CLOT|nr:helix-hairpin-helix domain-containing protein [Clostridium niameyense]NEZ45685.1 DNA-binding protein [Clostridium niameyense]